MRFPMLPAKDASKYYGCFKWIGMERGQIDQQIPRWPDIALESPE